MKGRTKITINRETVRDLLEEYVAGTFTDSVTLKEFTVHRNSSIELVVEPRDAEPALPLDEERTGISQE